jgi:hypothetical protein
MQNKIYTLLECDGPPKKKQLPVRMYCLGNEQRVFLGQHKKITKKDRIISKKKPASLLGMNK